MSIGPPGGSTAASSSQVPSSSPEATERQSNAVEASQTDDASLGVDRSGAVLRTLVVCDMVNSTALVERLGDEKSAELIREHDQAARLAIKRHGGREIDKTDGFLVLFTRPVEAVAFALDYQYELRALAARRGEALAARVGIHVGEVRVWTNSPLDVSNGAKPIEVEGLAKPVAARLMALALPGQILVSGVAHALAQRAARELDQAEASLRWVNHGRYQFKGLSEPLAVFEVGVAGVAPMRAPPNSSKGSRTPIWRRPFSLGLAALLAGGVLTMPLYVSMWSEPALAFGERDWVVLGDLVDASGDESFGTMLTAAFRIAMEQSRFVNLVSDAQAREALQRMQSPADTRIDRRVASEIALREQARAVIVPSVLRLGGRLRLTAELIEPHNARTVSTQTVDVEDQREVLSALDGLVRGVRRSLGESLRQIGTSSQPLEKVATSNLEALRAYSRAQQARREGNYEQALNLLSYAIELDPGFATAYARMAAILYSHHRYGEARAALDKATTNETRLTERERLSIRAHLARFGEPKTMLDLWGRYADLYPDTGTGQNNVGTLRYMLLHDYAGAETALTSAANTRNPLRNLTLHSLGYVLLAQDRPAEAEQQFRTSLTLSPAPVLFGLSDALAAQGRYEEAWTYLEGGARLSASYEVERALRRATVVAGQGRIDVAVEILSGVLSQSRQLPTPNLRWRVQAALCALYAANNEPDAARDVIRQQLAELLSAASGTPPAVLETFENLLYAAAWGARLGLQSEARRALALARTQGAIEEFPVRARLAALAQAELELRQNRAAVAATRLRGAADGTELWEEHELRARALRALGDIDGERAELQWLVAHPGLAHAEWIDELLGQQARVIQMRLASLRLVTLSQHAYNR